MKTKTLSSELLHKMDSYSCGKADFTDKVLSGVRYAFGGHMEKTAHTRGGA